MTGLKSELSKNVEQRALFLETVVQVGYLCKAGCVFPVEMFCSLPDMGKANISTPEPSAFFAVRFLILERWTAAQLEIVTLFDRVAHPYTRSLVQVQRRTEVTSRKWLHRALCEARMIRAVVSCLAAIAQTPLPGPLVQNPDLHQPI